MDVAGLIGHQQRIQSFPRVVHTILSGLHHVTAIVSDPQANIDFYSGLRGLRLVKKTVNSDDPSEYHLYYGDETGAPGSIVTFFPGWVAGADESGQGRLRG